MKSAALTKIAEINPKGPKSGSFPSNELFDFVPMASVSEDGKITIETQRPYSEVSKGYTAFQNNDVLVAKITPCFENNKIAIAKTRTHQAFGSTEFHVIRPNLDELDPRYLTYFLRQDRIRLAGERQMTGSAGQRRVPKSFLKDLEIPLPPLEEQERIATILDQANELCRLRQRSIGQLEDLSQAIFYDLFGDPSTNPKGWDTGTIRDLMHEVRYGTAKKAHKEPDGLPMLRMGNITFSGQLDLRDMKYIQLSEKELPKHTVRRGDIIFNRTNSKELVGKTAVYDLDEEMAIAGYLVRARVKEEVADPYFISGYLNSPHGKATLQGMCKNIVGMANINAQEFQDIPIYKPDPDTQEKYRKRIESIRHQREILERSLDDLDKLFSSLQQRAFRGDL